MGISKQTYLIVLPLVPEIHADLLWDLTLLFTVLGFLYFIFVFIFRNRLSAKHKGVRLRKKELGPMISNFLFYEDDASLQEKYNYVQMKLDIRELLKDKFNRRVLVEILLDLRRDISGDARQRLFALYKDLGLHLDAFEKLKSWKWEVISKAISELTQLQVEESYGFIKKFINHRRGVIRKQAQRATVSLRHEGIIYFLDTCKYRISEWQQLKLLDEIRNLEDFQPPRFKAWLTAKNKDVVLFSLRLIKYYKQNDAKDSLIQLVKHENEQIKIEAINCIKDFVVFDAVDTLKSVFWKCSPNVKLVLLDAIASLGEAKEIPFLRMVENKESNFMVSSKALSAINTISPESVLPTHGIEVVPDYDASEEQTLQEEAIEIKQSETKLVATEFQENTTTANSEEQASLTPPKTDRIIEIEQETTPQEVSESEHNEQQTETESPKRSFEIDIEEILLPTNDPTATPNETPEEQQLSYPETQDEFTINDTAEFAMENKDEISFESEDIFELLKNKEENATPRVNSEEAYWASIIDPDFEDETIFELCFMEELDEILSQTDKPESSWTAEEILPLDFLPIIENEQSEQAISKPTKEHPILDLEVEVEVVDENEKFAEELNRILDRIKNTSDTTEEEALPDFIPIVVEREEDSPASAKVPLKEMGHSALIQEPDTEREGDENQREELAVRLPWEDSTRNFRPDLTAEALKNLELIYDEIQPFTEAEVEDKTEEETLFDLEDQLQERVSIFNELFRTCDAESKLILLDEILAVGDERDLKFLETLLTDENLLVRKKAQKIAIQLKAILEADRKPVTVNELAESEGDKENHQTEAQAYLAEDLNEDEPTAGYADDLFNIDFEINSELSELDAEHEEGSEVPLQTEAASNRLIDEILSLPAKIIDKLNG